MNQKWRLRTLFVLFGIFFMTSSNAWGETWNRAVINSSKKDVTVRVEADNGNVWFGGPCNNENGPCTIPPGTRVDAKYTTTGGYAIGRYLITFSGDPIPDYCAMAYWGSSWFWQETLHFIGGNCSGVTEVPGWKGYLELKHGPFGN